MLLRPRPSPRFSLVSLLALAACSDDGTTTASATTTSTGTSSTTTTTGTSTDPGATSGEPTTGLASSAAATTGDTPTTTHEATTAVATTDATTGTSSTGDTTSTTGDPGSSSSGGGPVCGDGVVEGGETCDDGGGVGCDTYHDGGDGACVPPGTCSPGHVLAGDVCVAELATDHVHIMVDNTCEMNVMPASFAVPPGQKLKLEYHNHSQDYAVDVWMHYNGGFTDLPPGQTWKETYEHCFGPNPSEGWAEISTACSQYVLPIKCL